MNRNKGLTRIVPDGARIDPARLSSNQTGDAKQEKDMQEFTLQIDGMHCGSCVRRVSQALASVEGAQVNEVRLGAARLTSAAEPAPIDAAIDALAKAGYTAHRIQ
jgi:copper chaperone